MNLGEKIVKDIGAGKWDGMQLQFRCIRLVKYDAFVSYTTFPLSRKRQVSYPRVSKRLLLCCMGNDSLAIENSD